MEIVFLSSLLFIGYVFLKLSADGYLFGFMPFVGVCHDSVNARWQ